MNWRANLRPFLACVAGAGSMALHDMGWTVAWVVACAGAAAVVAWPYRVLHLRCSSCGGPMTIRRTACYKCTGARVRKAVEETGGNRGE